MCGVYEKIVNNRLTETSTQPAIQAVRNIGYLQFSRVLKYYVQKGSKTNTFLVEKNIENIPK